MAMCVCSTHCVLSPYHEKACCDAPTCGCWCHQRDKEVEDLRTIISSFADELEDEEDE
ncbi:MAG: hypothetical protein L0226_14655 [Acidobacteria bacterium]|nr:hypothetical protein [Acidobacteriota bacterium]